MAIQRSTLTHGRDAIALSDELDFDEMIALSGLFRLWAIYEHKMSPEQRTWYIALSADLEELAGWVGESWRAADPPQETTIGQFIARRLLEHSNLIDFKHAKHVMGLE